jgi:hypothetical protein
MVVDRGHLVDLGLVLGLVTLIGWVARRETFRVGDGGEGRLGVPESSGLAVSRRAPGVLWTHADSGAPALLVAVDGQGRTLAQVHVREAGRVDWEDLTIDAEGALWIGDIGNNGNRRRDLAVYRVPEPDPRLASSEVRVERTVRFSYPDQREFPPAKKRFDAEALFWARGRLYVLTKHRGDAGTTLYRFPALDGRDAVVLERISGRALPETGVFAGMVTAADVQPQTGVLAVLTYQAIYLFDPPAAGDDWLATAPRVLPPDLHPGGQCEALAWDGDRLVASNEAGELSVFVVPDGGASYSSASR